MSVIFVISNRQEMGIRVNFSESSSDRSIYTLKYCWKWCSTSQLHSRWIYIYSWNEGYSIWAWFSNLKVQAKITWTR